MEKSYCTHCGSEIVKISEKKGSYAKYNPEYYDEETGQEIWHEKWACPKASFWSRKHTEYYYNIRK